MNHKIIFALVADYGAIGKCVMEMALDGDANTTLADAVEAFDDNTVGVKRFDFEAGTISDVSKEAASLWFKTAGIHHEWGYLPVPPIVAEHMGDEIEDELTHSRMVAQKWNDHWRLERLGKADVL